MTDLGLVFTYFRSVK